MRQHETFLLKGR